MKKGIYFIFSIFVFLLLTNVVKASTQFICEYAGLPSNDTTNEYIVTFNINGDVIHRTITRKRYNRETSEATMTDVTDAYSDVIINLSENSTNCPDSNEIFGYSITLTRETINDLGPSQCDNYKSKSTCNNSGSTGNVACIWNETEYGNYCAVNNLMFVQCGNAYDIPHQVPKLTSMLINLLKIVAPIILIVVSVMSLIKALAASNEDEIKKAQKSLIRKIIAAVMVFFIISIVQFIIMKVADDGELGDIDSCLACFLDNECENSVYVKSPGAYIDTCFYPSTYQSFACPGSGSYKVTFDANGGKWKGSLSATIKRDSTGNLNFNTVLYSSDKVTKEGYDFRGWARKDSNGEIDCSNPLNNEVTITNDQTFYACWEPIQVTPKTNEISFELGNGVYNCNGYTKSYFVIHRETGSTLDLKDLNDYNDQECEIVPPEGYKLAGWTDNSDLAACSNSLIGSITVSGDDNFYACWIQN